MITSFKIKNFEKKMHEISKYIVANIYLLNTKNDKKIISIIRRKIHLIDDLKTIFSKQ